jgi:hypothetical protein
VNHGSVMIVCSITFLLVSGRSFLCFNTTSTSF